MKKDNCKKCKKLLFIEDHHILPQSTFGKNEHIDDLCPTCHTEYHQYLGTKDLKNENMEFHFEKYYRWLYGLGVLGLLVWLVL